MNGEAKADAGGASASDPTTPVVTVYVATYNTSRVTELCIRTARRYAGHPFRFVVGDCGSTDDTLDMLRRFAADGTLEYDVAPDGRRHGEWLDLWYATCPTRYCVFVDSDVELLRANWLRDLMTTAEREQAALVAGEWLGPKERRSRGFDFDMGGRPAAWLFLVDREATAGIDTSFGFHLDESGDEPLGYDTAGAFARAVEDAGLRCVTMPAEYRGSYVHYGRMTEREYRPKRTRRKQRRRQVKALRLQGRLRWQRLRDFVAPPVVPATGATATRRP